MASDPRQDLVALLRERDRRAAEQRAPRSLDARVQASVQRDRWLPRAWPFGAVAVVAAAVFAFGSMDGPAEELATHEPQRADFEVTSGGVVHVTRAGRLRPPNQPGITVRATRGSRLRNEAAGVRVYGGTVDFAVQKVPAGAQPVRVLVEGGVIEVLGTRFRVTQDGNSGEVRLHEGSIRFVPAGDGAAHMLKPGDTHRWGPRPEPPSPAQQPASAPPAAAPKPPAEAPSRRPLAAAQQASDRATTRAAPSTVATRKLERLHALRRARRFDEAVDLLQGWLRGPLPERERAALHFELGDLYERAQQLDRACAHWRAHATSFAAGPYAEAVERARSRLGCRTD